MVCWVCIVCHTFSAKILNLSHPHRRHYPDPGGHMSLKKPGCDISRSGGGKGRLMLSKRVDGAPGATADQTACATQPRPPDATSGAHPAPRETFRMRTAAGGTWAASATAAANRCRGSSAVNAASGRGSATRTHVSQSDSAEVLGGGGCWGRRLFIHKDERKKRKVQHAKDGKTR